MATEMYYLYKPSSEITAIVSIRMSSKHPVHFYCANKSLLNSMHTDISNSDINISRLESKIIYKSGFRTKNMCSDGILGNKPVDENNDSNEEIEDINEVAENEFEDEDDTTKTEIAVLKMFEFKWKWNGQKSLADNLEAFQSAVAIGDEHVFNCRLFIYLRLEHTE